MVAQEVLAIEHWLVTRWWHSPCAAWPGHYLGNTRWLDGLWDFSAHDKSLTSQTNSCQFWRSLKKKQQHIVLEREELWEHLALESWSSPDSAQEGILSHLCAKIHLHINVWSYFQSCPKDGNGEKANTPHLQSNQKLPWSSLWQERDWCLQHRQRLILCFLTLFFTVYSLT